VIVEDCTDFIIHFLHENGDIFLALLVELFVVRCERGMIVCFGW